MRRQAADPGGRTQPGGGNLVIRVYHRVATPIQVRSACSRPVHRGLAGAYAGTVDAAVFEVTTSAAQAPAAVVDGAEILAFAERLARAGGAGFSDQHRLAASDDLDGRHLAVARDNGEIVAVGQLVPGNETASLEVLVADGDPERAAAVVAPLLEMATMPVHWWRSAPTETDIALARSLGAVGERRLLQMRRSLPIDLPVDVTTRAFRVGADEAAWVAVNNRAFATHPEQGRWTLEDVRARESEAWFDPDGFRLHERDGRLAAFCWTKLHRDHEPVLGEIYVIGVDPDFQGLGLGRSLTLAGLASIAERHVTHGMLYVDEDNIAAVGLYRALGFEVHHVDVAFVFTPVNAAADADRGPS